MAGFSVRMTASHKRSFCLNEKEVAQWRKETIREEEFDPEKSGRKLEKHSGPGEIRIRRIGTSCAKVK